MRISLFVLLLLVTHSSALVAQQAAPQQAAPQQAAAPANTADAEKQLASIDGRLTDANTGEPVRKATLTLMQMPSRGGMSVGGPPPTTAGSSDAEGKFSFTKLEPGTYMLSAEKTGYVRQQYGSRTGQFGPGTNLTLKAGDKVSNLDFKLPRQAVITGRVLDEDGEPLANAGVSVLRQQPFGRAPQMFFGNGTNDMGEFRIANLTPGKYYLRAQKGGYYGPAAAPAAVAGEDKNKPRLDYIPTYYPNVTEVSAASPIAVTAGQQLSGFDIQLKKGGVYQISGKLNGMPSGTRLQISLQPKENGRSGFFGFGGGTSAKQDGTFVLPSVQPGSYDLIAMSYESGRPTLGGRTEVTVSNANVENVTINASTPVDISGRVIPAKAEDGAANADKLTGQIGLISLNRMPSFTMPTRIQDDGTFRIVGASRDKLLVQIFGLPEGQYVQKVMAGSADVTETGLDLTASDTAPPLEVYLSAKGAAVEGNVLDKDGKPVSGSFVLLLPHPYDSDKPSVPMLRKTATTDQSGHYSIKGVAPGDYRLYAWETFFGLNELDAEMLRPFEKNAATMKLKEGAQESAELKVNAIPVE